eukprot:942175-Rhodomonas_salina.1
MPTRTIKKRFDSSDKTDRPGAAWRRRGLRSSPAPSGASAGAVRHRADPAASAPERDSPQTPAGARASRQAWQTHRQRQIRTKHRHRA